MEDRVRCGGGGSAVKVAEAGCQGVRDKNGANNVGSPLVALRAPWGHVGAVNEMDGGDKGALAGSISIWICHGQTCRVDVMDGGRKWEWE